MGIKHRYIIRTKYFRIYFGGSYAWFEIMFGESSDNQAIYLFNTDCVIKYKDYRLKSIVKGKV